MSSIKLKTRETKRTRGLDNNQKDEVDRGRTHKVMDWSK